MKEVQDAKKMAELTKKMEREKRQLENERKMLERRIRQGQDASIKAIDVRYAANQLERTKKEMGKLH